ncbi:MAG: 16S rRNA (cytidine(1402)-2'-O)-methyltransferase [Lachnospiraceae bacterium]|nr:16S rRNA (cytidine(1402)-2'-O)-methyltransferase [Lachnospiraceae bacterium]MBP5184746.1 16S rRNA (cytidine(1402)-2'-O)-methyltransferase [Lachnospiraceae bacterium]
MAGTLYLVATPIGNLEDMTFRAIRVLKEADIIAAEDTRNSMKLLNHFEIQTPITSYHEFNKIEKGPKLVQSLLEGKNIALITDAGTPGISDPGEHLVMLCAEEGITVTPVPGACACVNALIVSGLKTGRFAFEAFLPFEKKERNERLEALKNETRTIVVYEAPHRLKRTLSELFEALGDRKISVVKEITKKHETVLRTTLSQAVSYFEENEPKGEYALVIDGKDEKEIKEEAKEEWSRYSIEEHMQLYLDKGLDKKEAMKAVAKDRGVSKSEIYKALL